MIITISGLAGSGTSSVARILSRKLKIKYIDAGDIWDKQALEKNTNVVGLAKIAESDDSIDRKLDETMLNYAKNEKDIILEGRLIGALCSKEKIKAFKIWLDAPINVRVERINWREKKGLKKITEETKIREESNAKRYKKYYNIDILDKSSYDLVISSEKLNPEKISELIFKKAEEKNLN